MALHAPSTTYPPGTLGDAAFSSHPEEHSISSAGHVFLNNGKPWNSYLFHGSLTDTLLVRLHKSGQRHGTRACFRSFLQWFSQRHVVSAAPTLASLESYYHVTFRGSGIRFSLDSLNQRDVRSSVCALHVARPRLKCTLCCQDWIGDPCLLLRCIYCTWTTLLWHARIL